MAAVELSLWRLSQLNHINAVPINHATRSWDKDVLIDFYTRHLLLITPSRVQMISVFLRFSVSAEGSIKLTLSSIIFHWISSFRWSKYCDKSKSCCFHLTPKGKLPFTISFFVFLLSLRGGELLYIYTIWTSRKGPLINSPMESIVLPLPLAICNSVSLKGFHTKGR